MAALARARTWILSGAEFELALRPKIEALFPGLPLVDGTAGVQFRALEEHADEAAAHEDGLSDNDHGHDDGIDRHTWLGREPAKIMAAHILTALIDLDPDAENQALYRENYRALIQDIDREFDRLREELAPLRGTVVLVYHPAFGYFLDEFGIRQEAVETGGKEPTPRALARLITTARERRPRAIFVQAQFPTQPARAVADTLGADLLALDPLAPDWLLNIRRMGAALTGPARQGLARQGLALQESAQAASPSQGADLHE
jgi:zinc transport system substrate-binding protein